MPIMTGETLTRALRRLDMTQQAFAEYIGVDARTVRRYQCDESPIPQAVARLVRTLLREQGD